VLAILRGSGSIASWARKLSKSDKSTVIFDFGAHKGRNIPYYLQKATKVVAIEANPELCVEISKKYRKFVSNQRLIIVNTVIVEHTNLNKFVDFYINENKTFLSSLKPMKNSKDFKKVSLPSNSIEDVISQNLEQNEILYFAKFDLEGFDAVAVREMFKAGYYPQYVSLECHDSTSLTVFKDLEEYSLFKIVDGESVSKQYKKVKITSQNGSYKTFRFEHHSAGPFGEDIHGDWVTFEEIESEFERVGFGWKDICAKKNQISVQNS